MTTINESCSYSLFGDLDGMSVSDIRKILDQYPDDAVIDARTEPIYGYGGWTDKEREFFVFRWREKG